MDNAHTLEIMRTLGALEAGQRNTLDTVQRIEKRMDSHGDRLSLLENWKAKVIGIAAAVSALVSFAAKVLP